MLASLRMLLRSMRTTFPLFIRAKLPFSLASAVLRGKLTSTMFPGLTGVAIGRETRTPVLLIFALRPLKNLFASGSQTLTGHESSVLTCCRCSATVSIFNILMYKKSFHQVILCYRQCQTGKFSGNRGYGKEGGHILF